MTRAKPGIEETLATLDKVGEQLAKTAGDVRAAIEDLTGGLPLRQLVTLVHAWEDEAADEGPESIVARVLLKRAQEVREALGLGERQ